MEKKRRINTIKKAPVPKKSWFEKNLRVLFIIAIILFLIQSMRGCTNSSSLERKIKKIGIVNDSISNVKEKNYIILEEVLDESQKENQRLIYELKVAGVKADAAEKRAAAIQRTAERIKQNTTITIEADTTRNRINSNKNKSNQ